MLEPVVQLFQSPRIDLSEVWKHIELLVSIFTEHRKNSEGEFSIIWDEALKTAALLNVELSFPRIVGRQLYRSNIPNPDITNAEEYYRTSVFIPYLDDIILISSLKYRFSGHSAIASQLAIIHPQYFKNLNKQEFLNYMAKIEDHYTIQFQSREASIWFDIWKDKDSNAHDINCLELLKESSVFFPNISRCIKLFLTLPVTTCSVERSFSTLRLLKNWLRSTISEERLNGLGLMNRHHERIENDEDALLVMFSRCSPRNQEECCFDLKNLVH